MPTLGKVQWTGDDTAWEAICALHADSEFVRVLEPRRHGVDRDAKWAGECDAGCVGRQGCRRLFSSPGNGGPGVSLSSSRRGPDRLWGRRLTWLIWCLRTGIGRSGTSVPHIEHL